MILVISNTPTSGSGCIHVKPELLNSNLPHLVIKSSYFTDIYIELDEVIQEGRLRRLHEQCPKIHVFAPETLSRHQMLLMTELFPEQSGLIRKEFLKGGNLRAVLPEVWWAGDTPRWDDMQLPTTG